MMPFFFFEIRFSLFFFVVAFTILPLIGGWCLFVCVWLVKRIGRWGTGNTRQFLTSFLGGVVQND